MKKYQVLFVILGLSITLLIFYHIFFGKLNMEDIKTDQTKNLSKTVTWEELRTMVREKTEDTICDFFYLNNSSGINYAFVFTGEKREENEKISFQGSLWYVDGQDCILLKDNIITERFKPVILKHENVKHLLFQISSNQPNDSISYIYGINNQKPQLVLETSNYCFLDKENLTIIKTFFSNSVGGRIWQRYYLYWDAKKEKYQEYKGKRISEEEFLLFENAQEIRTEVEMIIKKELMEYNKLDEINKIEYEYLKRDNGIFNINFKIICEKDTFYYYAILTEKDGKINLEKWKDYDRYEKGYIAESGDFKF